MSPVHTRGGRAPSGGRHPPSQSRRSHDGRGRGPGRGRESGGRGRESGGRGRQTRAGREVGAINLGGSQPQPQQQQQQQQQQPDRSVEGILSMALDLVGFGPTRQVTSMDLKLRRFRSHFGVGPETVKEMFEKLNEEHRGFDVDLKGLLMALNWLKLYDPEEVLAARWGISEKNLRVKIRTYVEMIASLEDEMIEFGPFGEEIFIATVDGTHCPVFEPRVDPSSKWYSHKFHGAGLSYELAIATRR
jgi:hypothetical protein